MFNGRIEAVKIGELKQLWKKANQDGRHSKENVMGRCFNNIIIVSGWAGCTFNLFIFVVKGRKCHQRPCLCEFVLSRTVVVLQVNIFLKKL